MLNEKEIKPKKKYNTKKFINLDKGIKFKSKKLARSKIQINKKFNILFPIDLDNKIWNNNSFEFFNNIKLLLSKVK